MVSTIELRIGNKLMARNEIVNVVSIDGLFMIRSRRADRSLVDTINSQGYLPIPLSQEWISRAAFVRAAWNEDNTEFRFEYGDRGETAILSTLDGGWQPVADSAAGITPYGRKLTTVHEFQNWFYSLSGEELNFQ